MNLSRKERILLTYKSCKAQRDGIANLAIDLSHLIGKHCLGNSCWIRIKLQQRRLELYVRWREDYVGDRDLRKMTLRQRPKRLISRLLLLPVPTIYGKLLLRYIWDPFMSFKSKRFIKEEALPALNELIDELTELIEEAKDQREEQVSFSNALCSL